MVMHHHIQITLQPQDNSLLALLCGQNDENLLLIEANLHVTIKNKGHDFTIFGRKTDCEKAETLLQQIYKIIAQQHTLNMEELNLMIHAIKEEDLFKNKEEIMIKTQKGMIKPRTHNQLKYLHHIFNHDVNFGIGPAGTGKTYLAVACAIHALENDQVRRIVLVRPAVEAGERLGFLPGNLAQKVDPYLRPLYDALYEMLGFERVEKSLSKNIIEIAPLAYMRGRTLNNAFIILDESQNTTPEQMKMFLTRIGFGSTVVITGDVTQIDLAHGKKSGLIHVSHILKNIKGISFTFFDSKDVVRHPIVQQIVEAYQKAEENNQNLSTRRTTT